MVARTVAWSAVSMESLKAACWVAPKVAGWVEMTVERTVDELAEMTVDARVVS